MNRHTHTCWTALFLFFSLVCMCLIKTHQNKRGRWFDVIIHIRLAFQRIVVRIALHMRHRTLCLEFAWNLALLSTTHPPFWDIFSSLLVVRHENKTAVISEEKSCVSKWYIASTDIFHCRRSTQHFCGQAHSTIFAETMSRQGREGAG